jgi:hypothetical protein
VFALLAGWLVGTQSRAAEEPPAINPFGPVKTAREDARPGYLEMSDGRVVSGDIYLTRDVRLKIYDEKLQRQREIPLRVVKQIECKVLKEWMEREWRFKELAKAEKYYTGREYPAREYVHTITLRDDRTITGPLSGVVYVQPFAAYNPKTGPSAYAPKPKAEKFLLHKRDKGDVETTLESLQYVRLIRLGEEALEEGKRKAGKYRPPRSSRSRTRSAASPSR